jgi:hypothetical protein
LLRLIALTITIADYRNLPNYIAGIYSLEQWQMAIAFMDALILNDLGGSGGGTSGTVAIDQSTPGTTNLVQLPSTQRVVAAPKPFEVPFTITRPNNTTNYSIEQALNTSTTSTTVFSINLSSLGVIAGETIQIQNIVISSNANQTVLPQINVFVGNTTFASTNDGVPQDIPSSVVGHVIPCINTYALSSSSRCQSDPNPYLIQLASGNTTIYLATWFANAYTPIANEIFKLTIGGFVIGV